MNLQFWRGIELTDPENLLEGTGKKMRHIKIRGLDNIGTGVLKDMIREAVELDLGTGE